MDLLAFAGGTKEKLPSLKICIWISHILFSNPTTTKNTLLIFIYISFFFAKKKFQFLFSPSLLFMGERTCFSHFFFPTYFSHSIVYRVGYLLPPSYFGVASSLKKLWDEKKNNIRNWIYRSSLIRICCL